MFFVMLKCFKLAIRYNYTRALGIPSINYLISATSPSLDSNKSKKLAMKSSLLSPQSRLTSGNKFVETWKVCTAVIS